MWAATDNKSIQKVGAVADSARWLAKAANVPEELAHCLQLIQVISRDTKYLVELRGEHYSVLQNTPRELNRVDEILTSADQSLADVDRLLEKYRAQVDDESSKPSLPVLWLLSDSETFSIRARNLQTQHQTILNEINHLRSYRLISPVIQMASQTEQRQFENLDLLKSLMGGKRPAQDTSTKKVAQLPAMIVQQSRIAMYDVTGRPIRPQSRPQSSAVGIDKSMINDEPILAELPTDDSIRSLLPYNSRSSLPLNLHPSVSRLSLNPASEEQPSNLRSTKPADAVQYQHVDQIYGASPAPQMATGLIALFQKPIQLGEKPSRPPSTPPQSSRTLLLSQRESFGSSPLPILSTVPSSSSLISQQSNTGTHKQVFELDAQSTREVYGISHRPRSQTAGSGPYRFSNPKSSKSLSAEAHQGGRSQLFVYQPRSNSTSTSHNDTVSIATRTEPFYELEGSRTLPIDTMTQNTRLLSVASSTSENDVLPLKIDSSQSSVPEQPGYRRDIVDSAAWHRKTELFRTAG